MSQDEQYDAIIIGDGQAGGPLSTALVQAGRKTAVIEAEHAGGTCVNTGCTPTKTMVASARVAYLARRGADYGVHTGEVSVDMETVRRRKRDIVISFRQGSESAVKNGGVDLLMGQGAFSGPHTVEVRMQNGQMRCLSAPAIFINVGTRPSVPPIPGLDAVAYLDSTSIMELDSVPEHLLVLGGGYIGLEFAQMFRRFGSRVTIVEATPQILVREDADISAEVKKILEEDGVEIFDHTTVTGVQQGEDGTIQMTVKAADGERTVGGSHLLVAVGRRPNSDWLNLDAAGIEQDQRGFVKVNDRLETNVSGIYALGEIAGSPPFTHMSYDDFRIVRTNLLEGGSRSTSDRLLLYTVFIDPQLGRVGITETEARQQGRKIKVATMPMSHVARALETDESRGLVKAIVDRDTDQILGAAVLGLEGGEVMAMIEIAMMGKLPYTVLRDGIFAHPTLAEMFNNLFSSLHD